MHAKTGLITSTVISVFLAASLVTTGCASSQSAGTPSAQDTEITSDSTAENTVDDGIVEDILEDTDTSSAAEIADPGATAATAAAAEYATDEIAAVNASTDSTAAAAENASTDSTAAVADDGSTEAVSQDATSAAAYEGSTGAEDVASAAIDDGVPARDAASPDTELLESQLSEALVRCTGWGQSAGSSLNAAAAATELITWSGKAAAASADPAALKKAVKEEYERLTADQQENLKGNWFAINYDADTILNDFDDISGALEDAGCLAAAKAAASAPDAEKNWQAASNAIDSVLR